jgi:hypothetical protein
LSTAASGSFRQHTVAQGVDLLMIGSVDCLRVVGNTAYISGTTRNRTRSRSVRRSIHR